MSERSAELIENVGDPAIFAELAIDLSDCSRIELSIALYEHERAGLRPDTWPQAVRAKAEQFFEQWLNRNPEREPRAVTYGVARDPGKLPVCVLILHHAAKEKP